MIERSFELVEKKINDLIIVVEALKRDKTGLEAEVARLQDEVSRLENETNGLNKKIVEMTRERDDVKEKVERMLGRLEAIEL